MADGEKGKRAKRRGHGEGSIFQRTDGRWSATITVGYDQNGKRRRKTVYGATKKEVTDELTRLQNQKLNGALSPSSKITVGEFLEQWLESVRLSVRPSTHASYSNMVRLHVTPRIGGLKLEKLTPPHIHGIYNAMAEKGGSPRLQQMTHTILRMALKVAVKWGLVPRNVCEMVDRPRVPKYEFVPLNQEQAVLLLSAAKGNRFEALIVLALTSGMRAGELFGLNWADIDFTAGRLSIRRTLSELNGVVSFSEPKTAKSRRQIVLPPIAVDALMDHRKRMLAEGLAGQPVIFVDQDGQPLRRSMFRLGTWLPLLKSAGLSPIRFHDLRHTAATLLLSDGIHPKIVQERLGHSTITLTLDTYSHILPTMQEEASAAIAKRFPGKIG